MNASIRLIACLAGIALAGGSAKLAAGESSADPAARLLRDASMMLLKEGNARYVAGRPQHPHQDAERRAGTVAQGQEPFATILACSDSREPVELIFDRGIGDIFVVRVAGNIAGQSELATVEYGVGHLNTPLLVVMGHTQCGAVTAVVKGTELHGHLELLAKKIKPAADKAKADAADTTEAITRAIQANVWQTMEDLLRQSSVVREKISAGRLTLLGAVYDLELGRVTWLGPHPGQDGFIALANQALTDPALAKKLAAPSTPGPESAPAKSAGNVRPSMSASPAARPISPGLKTQQAHVDPGESGPPPNHPDTKR